MAPIPLIVERDEDDPDCGNLLVDGIVGGRPRRFILDTGAARTSLITGQDLHLEPRGTESGSGGVFAAADQDLAAVRDLEVGTIQIDELVVSTAAPGTQPYDLLGMDVLGRFSWGLFMSQATLTVGADHRDDIAIQDLAVGARGHLFLDLRWDQLTASACWDTGAGIAVVDASFAAEHEHLFSAESSSRGTDSTGATQETPTFQMAGPSIGGLQFAAHKVAIVDLSAINATATPRIDVILGFPALSQADWVIDVPARRWSATLR